VALESGAEVRHGGRCAVVLLLANGIAAAVDQPLEPLGLLARCRRGPIGKRADGVAALAPIELAAIAQDEGTSASGGDADAKALHRIVVGDLVAAFGRRQLP